MGQLHKEKIILGVGFLGAVLLVAIVAKSSKEGGNGGLPNSASEEAESATAGSGGGSPMEREDPGLLTGSTTLTDAGLAPQELDAQQTPGDEVGEVAPVGKPSIEFLEDEVAALEAALSEGTRPAHAKMFADGRYEQVGVSGPDTPFGIPADNNILSNHRFDPSGVVTCTTLTVEEYPDLYSLRFQINDLRAEIKRMRHERHASKQ